MEREMPNIKESRELDFLEILRELEENQAALKDIAAFQYAKMSRLHPDFEKKLIFNHIEEPLPRTEEAKVDREPTIRDSFVRIAKDFEDVRRKFSRINSCISQL